MIRAVVITQASLIAAKKAHKSMIVSLLFAPLVQFFERVPIGRILNRLSKDLTVLD
jgi:ABC-type multidrug transport system fused ATPase/permease subunit